MNAIDLLKTWRQHIAYVYHRRLRSDVYDDLAMHTCHGCGCGGYPLNDGLCWNCLRAFHAAVGATSTGGTGATFDRFDSSRSFFVPPSRDLTSEECLAAIASGEAVDVTKVQDLALGRLRWRHKGHEFTSHVYAGGGSQHTPSSLSPDLVVD